MQPVYVEGLLAVQAVICHVFEEVVAKAKVWNEGIDGFEERVWQCFDGWAKVLVNAQEILSLLLGLLVVVSEVDTDYLVICCDGCMNDQCLWITVCSDADSHLVHLLPTLVGLFFALLLFLFSLEDGRSFDVGYQSDAVVIHSFEELNQRVLLSYCPPQRFEEILVGL